jgi:hypothetical protein
MSAPGTFSLPAVVRPPLMWEVSCEAGHAGLKVNHLRGLALKQAPHQLGDDVSLVHQASFPMSFASLPNDSPPLSEAGAGMVGHKVDRTEYLFTIVEDRSNPSKNSSVIRSTMLGPKFSRSGSGWHSGPRPPVVAGSPYAGVVHKHA